MTCFGIFLTVCSTCVSIIQKVCKPVTFCLLVIKEQRRAWVGRSPGCARQPGATVCGVELEIRRDKESEFSMLRLVKTSQISWLH